jgi:hypothetical protein
MENLEADIQAKEAAYITDIQNILSQNWSNRTKIAVIHQFYIKLLVATDDLVSAAKLQAPPGGASGSV